MKVLAFGILFFCFFSAFSQEKYLVYYKNKAGTQYSPKGYLDSKAIERRLIHGVDLMDSTDFPVAENYVNAIKEIVSNYKTESRWLNASIVFANETQIELISKLPFVKEIEKISVFQNQSVTEFNVDTVSSLKQDQLSFFEAEYFRKNKLDGYGIRVAVFDAGFPNVNKHEAFEHIRKRNGIIKTFDFIKNRENVYGHSSHGTSVLSCIAGMKGDKPLGCATGAEFLLARTEYGQIEPFSEEENWLLAAEWADKNGAQIINSSLGYTHKRYFTEDMDGKKSLVARAALIAASKGILVVNAAGNEGSTDWKKIGTPADADSILTVGGIDKNTGTHIGFSSYGPSADFRLKPNVCAVGNVEAAKPNGFGPTQGTSFSSPLTAGFAACVLQLNPKLKCQELLHEIETSSTLFPYYDYAHGYGVPKASYFFDKKQGGDSFKIKIENDLLKLDNLSLKADAGSQASNTLLYYHISYKNNVLKEYSLIKISSENDFQFNLSSLNSGETIRIHINGTTQEYTKP